MKKALVIGAGVLAVGAAALGAAWSAGSALPEAQEVRWTVGTRQGPAAVWAVVSGFERQPTWRTDLASVEKVADIAGKPAWRESEPGGQARTWVTAAWTPPHSLRRDLVDDGEPVGSWTIDLLPEGMGTRVTLIERRQTPNPLARLAQGDLRAGGALGATYLRALADHLGDPQNQVAEVEAPGE